MIWIFLAAFALFTGVKGLYEDINDITNNLATDLAPLITLFGEQATKQFLSESTSFMDSIIFSIAPLGLITAVVSVIRIYGSSSFKSIIGRSQEAHGVAEAELCSSTSQDVCELWSNGGICRVFGRPRILEFIYNASVNHDFYPKYRKDERQDIVEDEPSCGIYPPNTLFVRSDEAAKKKMKLLGWKEVSPSACAEDELSANPNLTLNIGIRKVHKGFHWSVLIFSVLLQLSFFGYAVWATFYNPSFLYEVAPSPQTKVWFGLTVFGTVTLVFGMILCARLIDLKSRERRFKTLRSGGTSKIFWLQPGGQRVGDQLFHAFAYSENKDEYITSGRVDDTKRERTLLLAVICTISGWVLQFVGLRGSPGSIALFQLIATLIMSLLRAFLRRERLEEDKNCLERRLYKKDNLIEGHELDWQAMNIDKDDQCRDTEWRISDHYLSKCRDDAEEEPRDGVAFRRTKYFRAYYAQKDDRLTHAANYASDWVASEEALSSIQLPSLIPTEAQHHSALRKKQNCPASMPCPNPGAKIMRFRSRLAELTNMQLSFSPEQAWAGETRTTALQLQKALQVSAEYIFSRFPLDSNWKRDSAPKAIAWKSSCCFSTLPDLISQEQGLPVGGQQRAEDHFTVGFHMYNRDGKWSISSHQLEAVLGLWLWSLKQSMLRVGHSVEEQLIRSKMITVEKSKSDDYKSALHFWVSQTRLVREYRASHRISRPDNLSIPTSSLFIGDQSSSQSMQSSVSPSQKDNPKTDGFAILAIQANGSTSLLQLMAQDIYTVFINRIVEIVEDLRFVGDQYDYLTMQDRSLSNQFRTTPLLGLTNPHIDALANALSSTGVATQEEALMSIVPAFLREMKLSFLDEDVVQNLLGRAKSLRRDSKYREGAAVLTWMLSECPARFHKWALRCLGDLYRRAALSMRRSDQEFGISGMRDMKERHLAFAPDLETTDILRCYDFVYDVLQDWSTKGKGPTAEGLELYFRSAWSGDMEAADNLEIIKFALTMSGTCHLTDLEDELLSFVFKLALHEDCPELIEDLWNGSRSPKQVCGDSPLLIALDKKCELETFHSLLDWPGIDVDAWGSESDLGDKSRTPLVCAIEANRADVVCSILRKGANLYQSDGSDMTPLQHALRVSNRATIQAILEKGADIHESAVQGRTALHLAAEGNSEAVIQWLLSEGADIHEKDKLGRTALHFAASTNTEDVVRLLYERGADIREKDGEGQTPLHSAVETNSKAVIRLLLEKGADMYEEDRWHRTALQIAVDYNHQDSLRLLLEKSADSGVVNHHSWPSLWSHVREADGEVAQTLKENGIKETFDF